MERTSLYKKAANNTAAKPRPSTGCKKPEAPLPASEPSVVAAPPEVEVSSPVGVEASEPEVAVDSSEVWVRVPVPVGTVLLPPAVPFPPLLLPGTMAPPEGAAEPAPPTIELSMAPPNDVSMAPPIEVSMDVLLASAGAPAGIVSATAVLVKTGLGWVVTGVG